MIKRTPSRNTRSKGFKVKHVLQICLLLGVCFWLIYQVKHSHDKKKEFEEKDAKTSIRTQSSDGIVNLGRKGILPRVQDVTKDEKHEEEEEEESTVDDEVNKIEEIKQEQKQVEDEVNHEQDEKEEEEDKHDDEGKGEEHATKHDEEEKEDENKHEDEEVEEENKVDEMEDVGRGIGDDEVDERDQEKIEGEADREEDIVDEEKEREEIGEEKGSGSDEGEVKDIPVGHETSTEEQELDGGVENEREAREVHYKADDASSAVTHDTQTISTQPEKVNSENSLSNDLEPEKTFNNSNAEINGDQKDATLSFPEGLNSNNSLPLNVTDVDNKDSEINISKDKSQENETIVSASDDQPVHPNLLDVNTEAGNNSVDGSTIVSDSSQQNQTVDKFDSDQAQNNGTQAGESSNSETNKLEQVNDDTVTGISEPGANSTNLDKPENDRDSNSTTNTKPEKTDEIVNSEVSRESNSSTNSEPENTGDITKTKVTTEADASSGNSSTTNMTANGSQGENSESKIELVVTDENSTLSTDGIEAVIRDPIDSTDSSVSQDEKEARIDLGTLPENSVEGVNSRDAAAE